jgi:uncharacterized protein with HEPN domain
MSKIDRDYLTHILIETNYFGVDYDIVWDGVINEIPLIDSKIKEIMNNLTH